MFAAWTMSKQEPEAIVAMVLEDISPPTELPNDRPMVPISTCSRWPEFSPLPPPRLYLQHVYLPSAARIATYTINRDGEGRRGTERGCQQE